MVFLILICWIVIYQVDRAIQRLNNQRQSITLYSPTRDMLYASWATWFHGFCAKTDHFINMPLHFRLSISVDFGLTGHVIVM